MVCGRSWLQFAARRLELSSAQRGWLAGAFPRVPVRCSTPRTKDRSAGTPFRGGLHPGLTSALPTGAVLIAASPRTSFRDFCGWACAGVETPASFRWLRPATHVLRGCPAHALIQNLLTRVCALPRPSATADAGPGAPGDGLGSSPGRWTRGSRRAKSRGKRRRNST
jgi:hypothetical protein